MITLFKKPPRIQSIEHGSVLVIALVILLVLTMMAIAGVQSTSTQERMAGNMRDKDISFQFAEAALRDAELALRDEFEIMTTEDCFFSFNDSPPDFEKDIPCLHYLFGDSFPSEPGFFIRELPPIPEPLESLESDTFNIPDPSLYRITAQSAGGSADARTILEAIFKR
ncbi:pilus assembly PilX family protein [Desulfonatronum thiodismutans]|uniref:pilus assembly PilX family protein n=1 Tax=Desulfonatronum thiodismutans TaxID=159290 RepID=UPI00068C0BBA|nr:PilX N-terminal domain-containing pilus assembly protein [Desulfonatronum thiodismutans]